LCCANLHGFRLSKRAGSLSATLQRPAAYGQAVWPSKFPVLGMFFSCCGVIFAASSPLGTPRGPSFLRALSSSVGRSTSRVSRGIYALLMRWLPQPKLGYGGWGSHLQNGHATDTLALHAIPPTMCLKLKVRLQQIGYLANPKRRSSPTPT
jgi:hypothetical protein